MTSYRDAYGMKILYGPNNGSAWGLRLIRYQEMNHMISGFTTELTKDQLTTKTDTPKLARQKYMYKLTGMPVYN